MGNWWWWVGGPVSARQTPRTCQVGSGCAKESGKVFCRYWKSKSMFRFGFEMAQRLSYEIRMMHSGRCTRQPWWEGLFPTCGNYQYGSQELSLSLPLYVSSSLSVSNSLSCTPPQLSLSSLFPSLSLPLVLYLFSPMSLLHTSAATSAVLQLNVCRKTSP